MPEVKIELTAGTNVGLVRDNNEDDFVVCRNLAGSDWTIPQAGDITDLGPYGALLVVADGMGGANAGEVASRIAIETIQERFSQVSLSGIIENDDNILDFLCNSVLETDNLIKKHSKKHKETRGMGTTIVLVWLLQAKAYICWCGDSRCYVFNPTMGLTTLSKDHSFVQQLVDHGELSPENAHNHPMSNIITQSLGNATSKIHPDTRIYQLGNGDILLLCSDGLHGVCTDNDIVQVMMAGEDLVTTKNHLIEKALQSGGYDNVTVALCRVEAPSLTQGKMEMPNINATIRNDGSTTEVTEETNAQAQAPESVQDEITEEVAPEKDEESEEKEVPKEQEQSLPLKEAKESMDEKGTSTDPNEKGPDITSPSYKFVIYVLVFVVLLLLVLFYTTDFLQQCMDMLHQLMTNMTKQGKPE